jgi:hypothetical protein
VLLAASEATARGLARVILLGDPVTVANEAKKAGADISGCSVVDPQARRCSGGARRLLAPSPLFFSGEDEVCLLQGCVRTKAEAGREQPHRAIRQPPRRVRLHPTPANSNPPQTPTNPTPNKLKPKQNTSRLDKYVDALVEARKKKGISREVASDQVRRGGCAVCPVPGAHALLGLHLLPRLCVCNIKAALAAARRFRGCFHACALVPNGVSTERLAEKGAWGVQSAAT